MQPMSDQRRRSFLLEGTRTGHLASTRADGSAHVAPVWFTLDGDDLIFTTGTDTVKGRTLRRDPRASISVDDPAPPYAFVTISGRCELSDDADELYRWALEISHRYMGADLAEQFARRNAVPGELLVRLRPERTVAADEISG
jgi:PPOX class probable F420-dependent enzyme